MIDSFYHASHGALYGEAPGVFPTAEAVGTIEAWARHWARAVSVAFVEAYLATPGVAALLPKDPQHVRMMIRLYLADIAVGKLAYALKNAPERLRVPARLIVDLLEAV
jgi:predicted trehalose synthase